jgi:hypothetical protein
LEKYQAVILPHAFEMTDHQVQTLLDFMNNGGTIIAFGKIGTNYPNGSLASRPDLLSLQSTEGVKNYGKGKFVYSSRFFGQEYLKNTGIERIKTKNDFINILSPFVVQNSILQNYSVINDGGSLASFLYKNKNQNFIIHIVNYDFNKSNDVFSLKENISCKILTNSQVPLEAIYISPDFRDQKKLNTVSENGYTRFIIPHLESYGIIILQNNYTSPTIKSRYPENNQVIIGGDSIDFSVSVFDNDGNPIYYQWFINNSPVPTFCGQTFRFCTDNNLEGHFNVKVNISDATNSVSTEWEVDVIKYKFPKILFDESKNERNTISSERASRILPEHPEWILFGKLKSILDQNYIVSRTELENFSLPLNQFDLLILSAPQEKLNQNEIDIILRFLNNGGSLLFLGDAGIPTEINNLLQNFGIEFKNDLICSTLHLGSHAENPLIKNFVNHPSIVQCPYFEMNGGGYFVTSPPSYPLAFTSLDSWCDLNFDFAYNQNETKGIFTIIAASEYGKGRIIAIADNSFHDGFLTSITSPNDELICTIIKWLTEKVNLITTIPAEEYNLPLSFELMNNYPNPFNISTVIRYSVPGLVNGINKEKVTLKIFDILGREIDTIVDEYNFPGYYSFTFQPRFNLASGVYFYRLISGNLSKTKKMVYLK